MPLRTQLARNQLAIDPTSVDEYERDPLVSGDTMLKTVAGLLVGGYKVLADEYTNWPPKLPILIQHGEKDPATSPTASRSFIEKIKCDDKEHKFWPGVKHEGHNEVKTAEAFIEYAIRYVVALSPPEILGAPKTPVAVVDGAEIGGSKTERVGHFSRDYRRSGPPVGFEKRRPAYCSSTNDQACVCMNESAANLFLLADNLQLKAGQRSKPQA